MFRCCNIDYFTVFVGNQDGNVRCNDSAGISSQGPILKSSTENALTSITQNIARLATDATSIKQEVANLNNGLTLLENNLGTEVTKLQGRLSSYFDARTDGDATLCPLLNLLSGKEIRGFPRTMRDLHSLDSQSGIAILGQLRCNVRENTVWVLRERLRDEIL
ncbi:unnamed protein product [Clonostachys rhizophaga]|uniref:Uncharacterized protein n=1 Tax=Clonostachys rhizophaga TaxID=160324 RepID=A0A9N9UZP1_9HYPO|nr:unnamed protein product [Clonostachys rhizophaga]